MKKFTFFLTLIIFFQLSIIKAQHLNVFLVGDSIKLNIANPQYDIQWQQSSDSAIWTDIPGANSASLSLAVQNSPTDKWHFRAEMGRIACPNVSTYSSVITYKVITNIDDLQTGDWYHGGIVYSLTNGQKRIANHADQGNFQWGRYNYMIGLDQIPHQYNGDKTTDTIVEYHDNLEDYYTNPTLYSNHNDGTVAAKACDTLTSSGFNDWFLPAQTELYSLIENKTIIGGFNIGSYWSCTESSSFNSWAKHSGGTQSAQEKYQDCYVRCIRHVDASPVTNYKASLTATVSGQPIPVTITNQPQLQEFCRYESPTVTVAVSGSLPITYQWKKGNNSITGANNNNYTINTAKKNDEGYYLCEVSNLCKTILSDSALVIMTDPEVTVHPSNHSICLGNSVTLSIEANGKKPFSYQWKKNNIDISDSDTNAYALSTTDISDEGYYHCEVTNICSSTSSDSGQLRIITLTVDAGMDKKTCIGNSADIEAIATSNHAIESGNIEYHWSPHNGLSDPSSSNPEGNPDSSTTYFVTATDELGCKTSDSVHIFIQNAYQNQIICMVTVDSLANQNLVIWEKPQRDDILKFNVYRHSSSGYNYIGSMDYNQTPIFIDTASDPRVQSYEYAITSVDTCLNESDYSPFHKTMHLSSSLGSEPGSIELSWNDYLDNAGTFVPAEYHIYRGKTLDNIAYLTTVSNSSFTHESYTDISAGNNRYYRIFTDFPTTCDPAGLLKANNGPFSRSISNLEDNRQQASSISALAKVEKLKIYPNPMTEGCVIEFPNPENTPYTLKIVTISGKTVKMLKNITSNRVEIQRNLLDLGVYLIEIKGDKVYHDRLIVN
jgi:hypothetical protein